MLHGKATFPRTTAVYVIDAEMIELAVTNAEVAFQTTTSPIAFCFRSMTSVIFAESTARILSGAIPASNTRGIPETISDGFERVFVFSNFPTRMS